MRLLPGLVCMVLFGSVCAKPYSGRVKIAEETLIQARDRGIDYAGKLDRAIDGPAENLTEFILLGKGLDTSGAYFHYFHIYEAAELAGDRKLSMAIKTLNPDEISFLISGLREARGWLKNKKKFSRAFPETTVQLNKAGHKIDF